VDGLLAPRRDVQAIANALLRLLRDDTLARGMGRSGAERVRQTFQLDRTIERYYQLYASAATRRLAA
jgi:glycosyltransferase involved in cell wall biosynthesis